MQANDSLPADRLTQSNNLLASAPSAASKQEIKFVPKSQSYVPSRHAPRPVLLMAEMPSSQTAPADQQQWLVFTTWEQVQTPNKNSSPTANRLIADYETGASAEPTTTSSAANSETTAPDGSVHSNPQTANQITVTRLILKIYPAASFSTQPTFLPMRDGWFVLQL